jgi:hypothetical protein
VGDVAHREEVEREVIVAAAQRRRRGQDDVGVPGGLVEIDVHRDHEVQRVQRGVEAAAVGRRDDRVAGQGDERADPALARGVDLLGQANRRQLAEDLAQAPDAAGEPSTSQLASVPNSWVQVPIRP